MKPGLFENIFFYSFVRGIEKNNCFIIKNNTLKVVYYATKSM